MQYPEHLKQIYERWGEGPTFEQYNNAVAAYFKATFGSADAAVEETTETGVADETK